VVVPFLLAGSVLLGALVERVFAGVLVRLLRRAIPSLDGRRLRRLRAPLSLLLGIGIVELTLPWLQFGLRGEEFVHRLTHGTLLFGLFWLLARMLDLVGELISHSQWANRHPASRSLVPLGRRIGKVVVVAIAITAFLAELGYPIASLLAGLGIGGLAIALAAQKTVENLFGAFSIGADEPFREGDTVTIGGVTGTVEEIGLRSTKIRTADRTLVTIPNGKLADMQLESLSARDRLRLTFAVSLTAETTTSQLRTVVGELEGILRAHPKIWPNAVNVHVVGFSASSIDIEVMAWFQTTDTDEFNDIRQEVYFELAQLIPRTGTALALPTQMLRMVGVAEPSDSERA
jgi:MscS family membrane protein